MKAAELAALRKLDAAVQAMLAEDLPVQLASARQAFAAGDIPAAAAEVHAIRGSAGFCKLNTLHAAAVEAEECLNARHAGSGDAAARQAMAALASALNAVNEGLAILRDER